MKKWGDKKIWTSTFTLMFLPIKLYPHKTSTSWSLNHLFYFFLKWSTIITAAPPAINEHPRRINFSTILSNILIPPFSKNKRAETMSPSPRLWESCLKFNCLCPYNSFCSTTANNCNFVSFTNHIDPFRSSIFTFISKS